MLSVNYLQKNLVSGNMFLLFINRIKEVRNIGQIMTFRDSDIMVIISSFISCLRQIPKFAKTQQNLISGVVIGVHCGVNMVIQNNAKTTMMMLMNGTIGLKITLRTLVT